MQSQSHIGTFHFLSEPPPLRMANFCTRGVGFLNQRSRQKMNPSEIFFKGSAKKWTLQIFSSKGAAKTLRGRNPAIFRGVRIKNGTTHSCVTTRTYTGCLFVVVLVWEKEEAWEKNECIATYPGFLGYGCRFEATGFSSVNRLNFCATLILAGIQNSNPAYIKIM